MSERPIRWGILGTGKIARAFAADLALLPDAVLHGVGSRTAERARAFGAAFDVPHRHGSYQALAADAEVDVVYVATPHPSHVADVRLCLEEGRAVLCEKPFTLNAAEARALVALARARGLFLMEAMWTRYLPAVVELRRLLQEQAIGRVHLVQADLSARRDFDPAHRIYDRALGGGALLDLGVYPVSLAALVLGPPEAMTSIATLGTTSVDEQSAYLLHHTDGALAVLTASVRVDGPKEAVVSGEAGRLRLHAPWWHPTLLSLERAVGTVETWAFPFDGGGYQFEAAHVGHCLRKGMTESPIMPLEETVAIMETLDALRASWGLTYPGEAHG